MYLVWIFYWISLIGNITSHSKRSNCRFSNLKRAMRWRNHFCRQPLEKKSIMLLGSTLLIMLALTKQGIKDTYGTTLMKILHSIKIYRSTRKKWSELHFVLVSMAARTRKGALVTNGIANFRIQRTHVKFVRKQGVLSRPNWEQQIA